MLSDNSKISEQWGLAMSADWLMLFVRYFSQAFDL